MDRTAAMVFHFCIGYLRELYSVFMSMAPYFFFGLTIAGILHVFISRALIARHLQKDSFSSVVKAALFGVPLPLCSCGVVPAALSLRRSRASEGATVAFLITTPQTGADSIVATYGLLGPVFAVFVPFAALVSGIVGGLMTLVWPGKGGQRKQNGSDAQSECAICFEKGEHRHSFTEKIRTMARYAYREFFDDISVRLLFGIALSAAISLAVPDDFFSRYLTNGFLSMLVMIAVGVPLYVCATASIPIALALIDKGLSPGAALVFLTVGPATNAASITLIASTMGRRVVVIYLGVMTVMALLNGTILNLIFKAVDAPLPGMAHLHAGHLHGRPSLFPTLLSAGFALIFVSSLYRRGREWLLPRLVRFSSAQTAAATARYSFTVNGMTCGRCQAKVTGALSSVAGVQTAAVDLATNTATVQGAVSFESLVKAVESAGYRVGEKK